MKGLQDIRFDHRDDRTGTVRVVITDDCSQYSARIDYDTLLYALRKDLHLEVKE